MNATRTNQNEYHVANRSYPLITIGATEHGGRWDHNTHRIVLADETAEYFFGWPDPTDHRNSDQWHPGIDKMLQYPKFAWEVL